jgi:hypothetical protein
MVGNKMEESDCLLEALVKILEAKMLASRANETFLAYLVDMAILEARSRLNVAAGHPENVAAYEIVEE